jgi:hypothetical protein
MMDKTTKFYEKNLKQKLKLRGSDYLISCRKNEVISNEMQILNLHERIYTLKENLYGNLENGRKHNSKYPTTISASRKDAEVLIGGTLSHGQTKIFLEQEMTQLENVSKFKLLLYANYWFTKTLVLMSWNRTVLNSLPVAQNLIAILNAD